MIEGTASYGRAAPTMALQRSTNSSSSSTDRCAKQQRTVPSPTPSTDPRRSQALGRDKLNQPRANDGIREAIRVHTVAQSSGGPGPHCCGQRAEGVHRDRKMNNSAPSYAVCEPMIVIRSSRFRDSAKRPMTSVVPATRCARSPGCSTRSRDRRDDAAMKIPSTSRPAAACRRGAGYGHGCRVLPGLVTPGALPQRSRVRPHWRHRSRRGHLRQTKTGTGSTAAAIAKSTGRSTSLPSPANAAARKPRTTSRDAPAKARPNEKPPDASNASSHDASGACSHPNCTLTRHRSIWIGFVELEMVDSSPSACTRCGYQQFHRSEGIPGHSRRTDPKLLYFVAMGPLPRPGQWGVGRRNRASGETSSAPSPGGNGVEKKPIP